VKCGELKLESALTRAPLTPSDLTSVQFDQGLVGEQRDASCIRSAISTLDFPKAEPTAPSRAAPLLREGDTQRLSCGGAEYLATGLQLRSEKLMAAEERWKCV
jgi:hypothetical protein